VLAVSWIAILVVSPAFGPPVRDESAGFEISVRKRGLFTTLSFSGSDHRSAGTSDDCILARNTDNVTQSTITARTKLGGAPSTSAHPFAMPEPNDAHLVLESTPCLRFLYAGHEVISAIRLLVEKEKRHGARIGGLTADTRGMLWML